MESSLEGRIRNTRLPYSRGLMPVLEAIVNSIDSIEDGGAGGSIGVLIEREPGLAEEDPHGNFIPDIRAFEVTDDGEGFTEANFESFKTLDSMAKAAKGGKGIGRVLWLKAFDQARVVSVFREGSELKRRSFVFSAKGDGIESATVEVVADETPVRTVVRLERFKTPYREAVPKSLETVARSILEHALEFFVLKRAPSITVTDGETGDSVELASLFRDSYQPREATRQFSVGGYAFSMLDVFMADSPHAPGHGISFCANDRVVRTMALSERHVPHLEATLEMGDGPPSIYNAYVTAHYLDGAVNQERTDFDVDRRGELQFRSGPTWEEIRDAAVAQVEDLLREPTAEARQRAMERVTNFIEESAPQYRVLLSHRRDALANLPRTLSESRLDAELHRISAEWKADLRAEAAAELDASDSEEPEMSEERRAQRAEVIAKISESLQSDLALYVVERRMVLEFFKKMLGEEDGRFETEDRLHSLFFPMKHTSDDLDYDDHNLWLLDERLAYHRFLSSDLRFDSNRDPVDVDSGDRPDLLIYNRPMAYSESDVPVGSCVIVEFKRPERNDYSDEKNPVDQVLRYVELIREGKAKRADGSTITVGENLPFYCHIVATLTPKVRKMLKRSAFTPMPDGNGYFFYNSQLNTYLEVVSFRKLLSDATKRNRVFFDKLGIPLH